MFEQQDEGNRCAHFVLTESIDARDRLFFLGKQKNNCVKKSINKTRQHKEKYNRVIIFRTTNGLNHGATRKTRDAHAKFKPIFCV